MDKYRKLIFKNKILIGKMRTLANKERPTYQEQTRFNSLAAEFDKNEAKILQMQAVKKMQAVTGQRKRQMTLDRREKAAAKSYRNSAAGGAVYAGQAHGKNLYLYEEVPAWVVPPGSLGAADKMLCYCMDDLKLHGLQVRWCNEFEPGDTEKPRLFPGSTTFENHTQINGCIRQQGGAVIDNTIWINFTLDPKTVPRTVAHESRHAYQAIHQKEAVNQELDALTYANQAEKAYQYFKATPGFVNVR